ncbi:hypothetical protein [Klebsiella quasipneumoniae]|uniref:hypothetical protein n=1 Tax=Klebsiella quasipneumoniae TaxID=1463165 RepID=UPI000C797B62|nr:hypothetical protein [Klebsiella quasipneumoniae]
MTKSTITRERAQQIFLGNGPEPSASEERELARMTLVAMDSEPVAWTWHYREQWHVTNDKCRAEFVAKDGDVAVLPLYRHAQPVPVVPEEKSIPNTLSMYAVDAVAAIAEVKGWNACRAAMLQASPVCTCPSGDGSLRWPCPVHPGNSPAQSDCCPAQNSVNPEQKNLTPAQDGNHLVIPDGYVMVPEEPTDEMLAAAKEWTGLTSTAEVVYIKMLAAAPQEAINALIPLLSRNEQEVK